MSEQDQRRKRSRWNGTTPLFRDTCCEHYILGFISWDFLQYSVEKHESTLAASTPIRTLPRSFCSYSNTTIALK